MRIRHDRLSHSIAALSLLWALGHGAASAQTPAAAGQEPATPATPAVVMPAERKMAGARDAESYCAGFIEYQPSADRFEVIGGEQEQEQRTYGEGDYVFINAGAEHGVKVDQEFAVVRPRGRFRSTFTKKKGTLGIYTEDAGRLRVVNVKEKTSVALVTRACGMILLGDLLRDVPPPVEMPANEGIATFESGRQAMLDRFADPSGKQTGRIVLARDGREMITTSQVVFVDLGSEDDVKAGDRLTIYRHPGTGNITRFRDKEVTPSASSGFESDRFRGGKYSIKAGRVSDPTDSSLRNPAVTTPGVQGRRPAVPRKVVGEAIVLRAEKRTATVLITQVAQEVHTGDFVEVQ